MLQALGYIYRGNNRFTRPGKSGGTSVTLRESPKDGTVLAVSFSTNGPLATTDCNHKTYNPTRILAIACYGGDVRAAGKAIAKEYRASGKGVRA